MELLEFMAAPIVMCVVLVGLHVQLGLHVVRRGVIFVDIALAQSAALGAGIGVALGKDVGTLGSSVISLGVLVPGGTAHFDLIAAEVAKGIAQTAMTTGVPLTFGVVTAETLEQALERAGTKMGNKGWEAAQAAIEMAQLYRAL